MPPSSITLQDLSTRWLNESLGVFNEETLELYQLLFDYHIIPGFNNAVEISQAAVEAFTTQKKDDGLSEHTVSTMVKLLRRVLDYGAGLGLCPEPQWKVNLGAPKSKHSTYIITSEEEHRLSSYLTSNLRPMHLCIFLMLTTGISVSEVLNVKWEDVSIKNNYIRVYVSRGPITNRQNKTRKVEIGERQRIYLRKLRGMPEHYICSESGQPPKRAAIEARWRKIADTLLLPDVTLNDLRHSFAVKQLESGKSYDEVSRQLGVDNSRWFRAFYRDLVSADERERLEKAHLDARKERIAPEHINRPSLDEESSEYREKILKRREELRLELESLEGDLAIIRSLRNSDCVQGANRQGLYSFIEKVLGEDKDGKFLVEYLRCNMRVADMPLLATTTPQAIRRRVTHGFQKLSARLEEIYAVEGYDILGMFKSLCDAVIAAAPPVPRRPGPKPKETVENRYKEAMDALGRLSSIELAPLE